MLTSIYTKALGVDATCLSDERGGTVLNTVIKELVHQRKGHL
jgi:hypothetical protein